jgi:hypothetical protein
MAAAVVQLDGSVLIWHMMDWFSTGCCLYGTRSKSEGRSYVHHIRNGDFNGQKPKTASSPLPDP